jgi:hypothetical protein
LALSLKDISKYAQSITPAINISKYIPNIKNGYITRIIGIEINNARTTQITIIELSKNLIIRFILYPPNALGVFPRALFYK